VARIDAAGGRIGANVAEHRAVTRYLITGAQGFVGRYLTAHLLAAGSTVRVLGLGRSPRLAASFSHVVRWGSRPILAPLPPHLAAIEADGRYDYVRCDVNQPELLRGILTEFLPQVVIHLASGLRDDPPRTLFRTNVEGTIALLNAMTEIGAPVRRLVIGSTGAVYGHPAKLPICESHPCAPDDLYAISKLAQEQVARVLSRPLSLPLTVSRIFNVVGPGQDERHICGQLACNAAGIVSNRLPPVMTHGPLDTTRDFIDVRDAARAIALIANPDVFGGVFNIATGIESSMREVLDTILDVARLDGRVVQRCGRNPSSDVSRHVASVDRIHSLGFQPAYSLRKSLEDVYAYYLSPENQKKAAIGREKDDAGYRQNQQRRELQCDGEQRCRHGGDDRHDEYASELSPRQDFGDTRPQ
jgi:GDP-4-dehydro-6-deoxy-D-mannose reductase